MPTPSYTISVNLADSDGSPSWVEVDQANDSFVFCDTGGLTADQSSVAAVGRSGSDVWSPELWLYDASNSPDYYRKIKSYHLPSDATQRQKVIRVVQTEVTSVLSHSVVCYNGADRSLSAPSTGTLDFAYPLVKCYHSTSGAPSQYWGEASDTAMMQKDVTGDSNPNGIDNGVNWVEFTVSPAAVNYFCLSQVFPSDNIIRSDIRMTILTEYT